MLVSANLVAAATDQKWHTFAPAPTDCGVRWHRSPFRQRRPSATRQPVHPAELRRTCSLSILDCGEAWTTPQRQCSNRLVNRPGGTSWCRWSASRGVRA